MTLPPAIELRGLRCAMAAHRSRDRSVRAKLDAYLLTQIPTSVMAAWATILPAGVTPPRSRFLQ